MAESSVTGTGSRALVDAHFSRQEPSSVVSAALGERRPPSLDLRVRWQQLENDLLCEHDLSEDRFQVSPESLSFELLPNSQPGCPLSISNSSDVTIAFKVKTTEPKRYLVRPNQGLVGSGETMPVNVYLIEKECNELLQYPAALGRVSDKFLVQTAAVGDRVSAMLSSLVPARQSEELAKLWATFTKSAIRNKKLSVHISVGSGMSTPGSTPRQSPAHALSANPSPFPSPGGSQASPAGVGGGGRFGSRNGGRGVVGRGGGGGGGGGGLDENSRALANKYEDLVNYTANLTEERDELNQSLEEAKKALQREMATRIALESKGQLPQGRKGSSRNGGVRAPAIHHKSGGGFGYVSLAVVAVTFFFLGHWLDFASASAGAARQVGDGFNSKISRRSSLANLFRTPSMLSDHGENIKSASGYPGSSVIRASCGRAGSRPEECSTKAPPPSMGDGVSTEKRPCEMTRDGDESTEVSEACVGGEGDTRPPHV